MSSGPGVSSNRSRKSVGSTASIELKAVSTGGSSKTAGDPVRRWPNSTNSGVPKVVRAVEGKNRGMAIDMQVFNIGMPLGRWRP